MTKPKKVLQVLGGLNRGGAETLVMNIYRNIDREQIQFDFVIHTSENGAYYDEIVSLGGKVYHCPRYTGKNHFAYKKWWKGFFEKHEEYQVVHGHVRSTAAIYLKVAKKYGCYTIAHSHSSSSGKGIAAIIKNILQYPIRYTADYFLGCSQIANEWLFGKKVANDPRKCSILKNGIDITKFSYHPDIRNTYREELGIENHFVIGTVGRIEQPKNPFFILEIFNEILKIKENAKLLWVGDGALTPFVKEKIIKLNIQEGVLMVGSRDNVSDYLQAMDIFLFPSLWEGLGMCLIEAQATGLPCVCSDVIPHEADVTDLIVHVSLSASIEDWVNKCFSVLCKFRESKTTEIEKANYDIRQVVDQLRRIYGTCSNKTTRISHIVK